MNCKTRSNHMKGSRSNASKSKSKPPTYELFICSKASQAKHLRKSKHSKHRTEKKNIIVKRIQSRTLIDYHTSFMLRTKPHFGYQFLILRASASYSVVVAVFLLSSIRLYSHCARWSRRALASKRSFESPTKFNYRQIVLHCVL